MILLENWSVTVKDPYRPPEASKRYLQGTVYGHHRKEDGTFIRTSSVTCTHGTLGLVHTNSGYVYKLGKIDPEYEKIYPNAEKKFFGVLND